MKVILLTIMMVFFSHNILAADLILNWGESYNTEGLTISCGEPNSEHDGSSGCIDAQSFCLDKGYSPASCSGLSNCAQGQAACMERGYSPISCSVLGNSNAEVNCIEKGYSPISCSTL